MDNFINVAAVVMITILALFASLALEALLLRGIFALMEPATAARRMVPPSIARGTRLVAQAYSRTR